MSNAPQIPDDQQDPELEADDQLDQGPDPQTTKRIGMFGGWGISAAVHVGAIALAAAAVFASPPKEVETPPVRINAIDPPEKPPEKKRPERTLEAKVELEVTNTTETEKVAAPTKLDTPTEDTKEAETDTPVAKGREEAVSDSEAGGSGAFMAMGAGGGGAGMFGSRSGSGKKRATIIGGGSKAAESAVTASLTWFKRHQSPDGKWDAVNYYKFCTDGGTKCEPGNYYSDKPTAGEETNVAVTGYALLCFLGAGYDHKTPNKYKTVVKKGIDYLLSVQRGGVFGYRNYEHPVATMALAEAYAMTSDPELKEPTQKAVNYILSKQNQDTNKGGLGWHYVGPNTQNDSSVTGWNVMALKSAYAGGLNIGGGMAGSKVWLDKAWRASNTAGLVKAGAAFKEASSMTAKDKSRFPYMWKTGDDEVEISGAAPVAPPAPVKDPKTGKEIPAPARAGGHGMSAKVASGQGGSQSLECVGLVCGVFLGRTAGDPLIESLANTVMEHQVPTRYPCNTYYMYYNTLAIFQVGGDRWKKWNSVVRDMLVNSQRKTNDCLDGSWDFNSTGHTAEIGRTISTAYNTLCLEVYYRYAQVQKHK